MNLNTQGWVKFEINRLFDVEPGKYYYKDDYSEGNTPYCSASAENNGVGQKIDLDADFEGNKIVTGKVGCTAFYQPNSFCATSDVNVLTPRFKMTPEIGLFITTVINVNENYRWNFGRQCRVGNTKGIVIKLPAKHDKNGTLEYDPNLMFSDNGYTPDWEWMESYIKSLRYKQITTKIKKKSHGINVLTWKPFRLSDIFFLFNGTGITKEEIECNPGNFPAIQSGEENNGCIGKIDKKYCVDMGYTYTEEPCLTVARSGSAGYVAYQPYGCVVGDSAKMLVLKDEAGRKSLVYLFLKTILMANQYKYTYGRKVTEEKYLSEIIMLPATEDAKPDWEWMENYMRSLPYSDRIQ